MNKITNHNSLDEKVFADELDFKTLEHILSCLNHITPKKVSRTEFESLNGDYLKATGEDKNGVFYDLFLPEDMMKGEYLSIIHFLDKKFNLNKFNVGDDIITSTKVMVKLILKSNSPDDLEELALKYGISEELKQELQPQNKGGKKVNFSQAKRLIKELKEKRKESEVKDEEKILKLKEKIGENPDDLENYSLDFTKELEQEFDLTFFRKGKNMLRYGMMTMTQSKQRAIIKYCEENDFEKERRKNGEIVYIKGEETIIIYTDVTYLDNEEKLLRDKIGIDKLKKELKKARQSGDQEKINQAELRATNRILEVLYEYPYQLTENNIGYQPSGILENKEIYCVGFSLLGHAFLSELGIKHSGLEVLRYGGNQKLYGHSALEVVLGGIKYYFDPTLIAPPILYKIENLTSCYGLYKDYTIITQDIVKHNFILEGDTEKILLSQIYNNRGSEFGNSGKYKEGLKMYEKSIKLNPNNYLAISGLFISLINLGEYKKALNMIDFLQLLNPLVHKHYNNMGFFQKKLSKFLIFTMHFFQKKNQKKRHNRKLG